MIIPEQLQTEMNVLTVVPRSSRNNTSSMAVPGIPGFELTFDFDHHVPLRPLEVYQTAIQLMYELALKPWDEPIFTQIAEQVRDYNLLMMFFNPGVPRAPLLRVLHCVAALRRAVLLMSDGVLFNQLRCRILIWSQQIGALTIAPLDDIKFARTSLNLTDVTDDTATNISALNLNADSGQTIDPYDHQFVINFRFYGKPIKSKEVSLGILEALATAAPFSKNAECKELEALSPGGECAIIIESVTNDVKFTYGWAARALKLLYDQIIVPRKRFGDVYLELKYQGQKFGELRMLRIVDALNGTDAIAHER